MGTLLPGQQRQRPDHVGRECCQKEFLRYFYNAYVAAPCESPIAFQVAKHAFYAAADFADAFVPGVAPIKEDN